MNISADTLKENFFHTTEDTSAVENTSVANYQPENWNKGILPKNKPAGLDYKDFHVDPSDWTDRRDPDKWREKIKKHETGEEKGGKVHREVDESNYLILTVERLEKEIGNLTDEVISRMSHWVLTCVNCGFKDTLTEFSQHSTFSGWTLKCPNCESKAVGIPKEDEHKLIKEILKGSEEE